MKNYLLIISLSVFVLSACGGEDSSDTSITLPPKDTTTVVGKPAPAQQGEVSRDGIEGFWQAADESKWLIKDGSLKKIAKSGVELSEESYEVSDTNSCTTETEGPYLIVKGAVTTCYKLLLLDTDSMHIQLSTARPAKKFVRL
jgi:hypothetical protein